MTLGFNLHVERFLESNRFADLTENLNKYQKNLSKLVNITKPFEAQAALEEAKNNADMGLRYQRIEETQGKPVSEIIRDAFKEEFQGKIFPQTKDELDERINEVRSSLRDQMGALSMPELGRVYKAVEDLSKEMWMTSLATNTRNDHDVSDYFLSGNIQDRVNRILVQSSLSNNSDEDLMWDVDDGLKNVFRSDDNTKSYSNFKQAIQSLKDSINEDYTDTHKVIMKKVIAEIDNIADDLWIAYNQGGQQPELDQSHHL